MYYISCRVCFGIITLGVVVGCCCICLTAVIKRPEQRQRQRAVQPKPAVLGGESARHHWTASDLSAPSVITQATLHRAHEVDSQQSRIR